MPRFASCTDYTGSKGSKTQTGTVRFASATEAAAGTSDELAISPSTLSSAVSTLLPDATTAVKGKVQLATEAECVTGTNNTKAVTPLGLAAVTFQGVTDASQTQKGIIEIANDAESVAATSVLLALCPGNIPAIMAAPGAIGGTTPAGGAFTTLSASGAFSLTGDQVTVAEGGTGAASLTDHGIMLGSGTGAVTVTAVGTNNQLLIGQTGADPIWSDNIDIPGTLDVTGAATLDSTLDVVGATTLAELDVDNIKINGNTISSTDTNGNINLTPDGTGVIAGTELTLTTDLAVAHGGTGASSLTDHSVLVGSGTAAVTAITVGTNGQVLLGSTGADPAFGTLTSSGTITFTTGAGSLAINTDLTSPGAIGSVAPSSGAFTTLSASGAFSLTGDQVTVAEGGTGASSLTDHGVMLGSGVGAVTVTGVGTNGQVLVGSTGADPAFATIGSANTSITPTLGAGTLSLDVDESYLQVDTVEISSAEVLLLATAPKELVAAPGADKFIEFLSAKLILDYNSVPYVEAGDNLAIRYTDGSGVIVSETIESTGFIDQAADMVTNAIPKKDAIVTAAGCVNKALVLDNTGSDVTAGNSPLTVRISYRIVTAGL